MRYFVQKYNNCDDILLNFVTNHFFPEIKPKVLKHVRVKLIQSKIGQTGTTDNEHLMKHFALRDSCFGFFTETLGYMPLYSAILQNQTSNIWVFDKLLNQITSIKLK